MKKYLVSIMLVIVLVLSFCGCGSDTSGAETENAKATVERDLPEGDYEDVGDGTLYILSASGSTEYGDDIVVYPDMDCIPYAFVDYELWDLDGSILTYVYVDGILLEKEQVGAGYQSSLDLEEEFLVSEGTHKVEAVQYADNDPSGEIVFYRSATFEVKNK